MTTPCVPTQNNCQKSGTGPGCTSATNSDGGKAFCLAQVKHDCEEKLKKCVDKECIEQNVKKYEREAEERARQRAAEASAAAEKAAKCQEGSEEYKYQIQVYRFWFDRYTLVCQVAIARGFNSAMPEKCKIRDPNRVQQIISKYREGPDPSSKLAQDGYSKPILDKDGNFFAGVVEIDTGSEKISNDDLFKNYGTDANGKPKPNNPATKDRLGLKLGNIARSSVGSYDYGLGTNPGEVNKALADLDQKFTEAQKAANKACPPPPSPPAPFDELEEQRSYNQKISRCIGACYYQAQADCKTSHCYCGSYKCDAGKQNPAVGDSGPGTDFPTQPGADPKIDVRDLSFTASSYDLPIELMYTRSYFPGNVLWISPNTEVRTSTFDRTFVPGTTTNDKGHYLLTEKLLIDTYISFVLGICAGPVDAIQRVWLDGGLLYDASADATVTIEGQGLLELVFHTGSEASTPISDMEDVEGMGHIPAFRGTATLLVKNLNLKMFTKFPEFKIEVVKVATTNRPQIESAVFSDIDVFKIWSINTAANKIFIGTDSGGGSGMRVVDYDTLETVREIIAPDALPTIAVTPLPYLLTQDGRTIGIHEIVYGTERNTGLTGIDFDAMFQTRLIDRDNTGWNSLVASNTAGDIYFHAFSDSESSVFSPSDWQNIGLDLYAGFDAILSGTLEAQVNLIVEHNETGTSQKVLTQFFFGFRGQGGTIECAGFTQNTTSELTSEFLELGEGFTFEPIVIDGAAAVTVLGAYPCQRDRTVILFLAVDGGFNVLKFRPLDGAVWLVEATALPTWDGFQIARESESRYLAWISGAAIYKLDQDTGDIVQVDAGTFPTLGADQRQYYDSKLGAITYVTNTNTIARVYVGRIEYETQTLTDVVRDVAQRAGFDVGFLSLDLVDDVPIKGYRTGTAITARQVLEPLFDLYPVDSYIDLDFNLVSKGESAAVEIDPNYILAPFTHSRVMDGFDTRSAALTYFSIELDGEKATQTFSLPDDFLDGRTTITTEYTILENDDYMRSLAELKVFQVQENDGEAEVQLPPRYLSVTPSDQLSINGTWRATEVSLGANLQAVVKLHLDANYKYNELLSLTGTLGFGNLFQKAPYRPIPFPLMWAGRCTMPDMPLSGCVFMMPQKLINDFKNPVQLGTSVEESINAVSVSDVDFAKPAAYGYLVTPPPADTRAFTTQFNSTMVVKFVDASMPFEQLFDYEDDKSVFYYTSTGNLLFVGNEHIKYQTYTIAMDGVTVTFSGLARARDNTEYFMEHTAGELVMVYDTNYTFKVERAANFPTIVKGASVNAYGEIRRSDKSALDPDLAAPLAVASVRRFDSGPAVASVTYPQAKDITISCQRLVQNITPLTDNYVAYLDTTSNTPTRDYCPNCSLEGDINFGTYYLRGAYNEATFDTFLMTGVFDSYVLTADESFTATLQESLAFDMTLETLTVVIISTSTPVQGTKASRRVVSWTPGDYTFRPTRGIVHH